VPAGSETEIVGRGWSAGQGSPSAALAPSGAARIRLSVRGKAIHRRRIGQPYTFGSVPWATSSERRIGGSGTRRLPERLFGTERLRDLFAADATYRPSPFDEPVTGLPAIGAFWEAEREGSGEIFAFMSEVVAVEGDTGVARLEVVYGDPPSARYRDLWILTLAADGRCTAFEEWPFFPDQPRVATAAHGA